MVTYARLGTPCFGTAPGEAELRATLRTCGDDDLAELEARAEELVRSVGTGHGLDVEVELRERFATTVNDPAAVGTIEDAAAATGLPVERIAAPFPWSEDFGELTRAHPGALFGLGAGQDHAALHSAGYEFPDALMTPGVLCLYAIARLALDERRSDRP